MSLWIFNVVFISIIYTMAKNKEKPMSFYTGRAGSWSRRQLGLIDTAIEKIENSNFIVRYFNKDSLNMLKKQKQYIKTMIEKEKGFVEYKRIQGASSPADIVKANKALERQLKAWEEIRYVSRKEENHKARKVRSDKGKTHNYKRKVLKANELKPRRLFYD